MDPALRRLGNRLRRTRAVISDLFAKSVVARPQDRDFGRDLMSQRMCPFCGLITSRYKTCCLECGKSLKPA